MNKKRVVIASRLFASPPADLDKRLASIGQNDIYAYGIMNKLYAKLDFKQRIFIRTCEIDGEMIDVYAYSGDTLQLSYAYLANNIMSRSKAIAVVQALEEKGGITRQRRKKANKGDAPNVYHINFHDDDIKDLKTNPDHPKLKEFLGVIPSPAEMQQRTTEAVSDNYSPPVHDVDSQYQEVKEQEPPVSNVSSKSTGSRGADERGGDFSNQEKARGKAYNFGETDDGFLPVDTGETIHFDAESIDVVPTKEIGAVTDMLTSAKGMTPIEDEQESVWAFMRIFKRPDGEEWKQSDVQPATILRERLESMLAESPLEITPIRFFEHCIIEMRSRVEDGKLDGHASSFNYFLNAITGKEIVQYCLDKLSSENARESDLKRTKARLDEQKNFQREGIPPKAQAELDELLGREDRSDI